jgi:hyperosmotically inducible periplasmic protein
MRAMTFVRGAAIGAAIAYLFDPVSGRGRRARLRDQAAATARRTRDRTGKLARHGGNVLEGKVHEATAPLSTSGSTDDATVADRIRSEVLGRRDLEAGNLIVDVSDGVAHLRGTIDDPRRAERVVDLTKQVHGVREVENLVRTGR